MMETVLIRDKEYIQRAIEKEFGAGGFVRFDEPMSIHTSLHLGGPADVYIEPEDPETLIRVLVPVRRAGFPTHPLGGGTNLLVTDGGVEGVVINIKNMNTVDFSEEKGGSVLVRAGSGLGLQKLLGICRREGFSGLESLAGIPGQLGGAVAGNAGAFGIEIKDVLVSLDMVDAEGQHLELGRDSVEFSYRRAMLPAGAIITAVTLRLIKDDPTMVAGRMDEAYTKKRETQPLGKWSAGCVFKNPPGDSAGRLIDAAGCKGLRQGGVVVSEKHANFFIHQGEGTAGDFLRLMDRVAHRVEDAFGVVLEPELQVIGR